MPRNGSGVFNRTNGNFTGATTWQQQANSAQKEISAPQFDTHDQDIADALTGSVPRDGQAGMTGNLTMGSNRITNLGDGTTRSDAASLGQIQDEAPNWLGTLGGTDAYTATTTPALPAYTAGLRLTGLVANANTGAVTLQIGTLDAKTVLRSDQTALEDGDLLAGAVYTFVYDGTNFITSGETQTVNELNAKYVNLTDAQTVGGVKTFTSIPVLPATNPTAADEATRKGYVDAYESPTQQTPIAPANWGFDFSAAPFTVKEISAFIVCLTAQFGYQVGDEVFLTSGGVSANTTGCTTRYRPSAQTAFVTISNGGIHLGDSSDGLNKAITPANWSLRVRARS